MWMYFAVGTFLTLTQGMASALQTGPVCRLSNLRDDVLFTMPLSGGTIYQQLQAFKCIPKNLSRPIIKKTDEELGLLSCVQRSSELTQPQFCKIFHKKNGLIATSRKIESSFAIPRQFLVCTALTETGLNPNASSGADWRGLFQIRPGALKHIKQIVKTNLFSLGDSWETFSKSVSPKPKLENGRDSNIVSSSAAAAIYFKWLGNGIETTKNKLNFSNPLHVYLLIAGYNSGPDTLAYLTNMPNLSINDIDRHFSAKGNQTTPEYFRKVINCMQKQVGDSNYLNFRPDTCNETYYRERLEYCKRLKCEG